MSDRSNDRDSNSTIRPGSVMMLSGTLVPESVRLGLRSYWKAWSLVGHSDGHALDTEIRSAGWSFFFLAGIVRSYAVGSGGEATVRKAMRSVLTKVMPAGFNSLEISEIVASRFCGIPYVRVTAHSRHVQKSNTMESLLRRLRKNATAALATT